MDILLHLGAHCCATTTFQSFVTANRARLATRGLTCWAPNRTRDGLMRGLVRDPLKISIEDERQALRSVGRMRIEFDRLQRLGQGGVLISDENLIGSARNNLRRTALYPLVDERLRRFVPAFAGRRLRIALCIRTYEDYWAASLARRIAQGGPVPTVDTLDYLTTQPRRWRHVLHDIARIFPKADILVFPFERFSGHSARMLGGLWGGELGGLKQRDTWLDRRETRSELNDSLALRGHAPLVAGPGATDAHWTPFDDAQRALLRAEYHRDLAWLKAGADGHVRVIEEVGITRTQDTENKGPQRPADQPGRADRTRGCAGTAPPIGGQDYGNEKGLGHAGAG